MKFVKIPKERVGAIIGQGGETKRFLESRTGLRINIDAEEGEVSFDETKTEDPLMPLKIMDIVKAIGRGFAPQKAFRLLDDDEYLELIEIDDYVGKSNNALIRVRSRVIGAGGKTRRIIEDLVGVNISVYGDTVGIIGNSVQMPVARKAVDMLLSGSEHATVYKFLERKRAELHIAEMGFEL
ncbi:MAG: KH domain-containing protein [Methanomassiliicoccales archaeon]|jgi:ribosomal RNA assembly protein|nr:KH domain-containing protein [Methanomassiliicoccales archaeon]